MHRLVATPTGSEPTGDIAFESKLLGALAVPEHQVLEFANGLFGFPEARGFALLPAEREGFFWLQSQEFEALTFLLIDPFAFVEGYSVDLGPLSDDPWVRDRIQDLRIGDQVRLKGYLARYSHGNGFERGTSTTRTDTGNGACETLYVEDVLITGRMNEGWHLMYASAWWGMLGSALFWLWGVTSGKIR